MAKETGLGRGLASLIPQKNKKVSEPSSVNNYFGSSDWSKDDSDSEITPAKKANMGKGDILEVEISEIVPNPYQPRKTFDEEKLGELAASIKSHGIIQPLVVSKNGQGYELIAGERRFQAAKMAGLEKVPVVVKSINDGQKLELAVVENIQRHDLNPVEEARAFKQMADEFKLSQEEIAQKLGKSRSSVANKLRLLSLPAEMQKAIIEEKISEGHAKALLAIEDSQKQKELFDAIVKNNFTVRQAEDKVRQVSVKEHKRTVVDQKDPALKSLEDQLAEKLATKVKIQTSRSGGKVVIDYYSQEELNNLIGTLLRSN